MHEFTAKELLSACRILFGTDVVITRDFLWYLQMEGAKSAYWSRAKESHPDAHPDAAITEQIALGNEFGRVTESYQLLCSFMKYREQTKCAPNDFFANWHRKEKETHRWSKYKSNNTSELFHNGTVPNIEVKIGRYLYFCGVTSFQSIIKALSWQREQRPSIGALARQWGWLDDKMIRTILSTRHIPGLFGERALAMGVLTIRQQNKLVFYQQSLHQRLGRYFILNGIVNEKEMEVLARERVIHNNLVRKIRE
jgi:hypothetical protein